MELFFTYYSPIGPIVIGTSNRLITKMLFSTKEQESTNFPDDLKITISNQLDEYFQGNLKQFDLPIAIDKGTNFQQKVWKILMQIPYGETQTYTQIAQRMGNKNFARAIGTANSQNQLLLLIPCHRVIGSNQQLSGYSGGIWRKKWLLQHELNHYSDK